MRSSEADTRHFGLNSLRGLPISGPKSIHCGARDFCVACRSNFGHGPQNGRWWERYFNKYSIIHDLDAHGEYKFVDMQIDKYEYSKRSTKKITGTLDDT